VNSTSPPSPLRHLPHRAPAASLPARPLVADTIRAHRWGTGAWILGAAVAMYAIAAGFDAEAARFTGGATAMAESMRPGVEAMRLLRWPAERLDTLGGYLTYHNITLFVLFLTLYAAVQGAHAIRGAEPTGFPAEILATGRSRTGVLVDRAVGFAATMGLISLGLGAGLALAMAAGGQPDTAGAFITALAAGLCAYTGYALAVLVSQLTPSPRAATGLSALTLTGLYLLTNVWNEIGPLGAIRYVSPFYAFNQSRALVPGHGLHVPSTLALVAAAVALLAAAGSAYRRRDYAAGLWTRRPRATGPVRHVQRPALNQVWTATLLRQRAGLLTWSLAAAAGMTMIAWLEPTVADMWNKFQYTQRLLGADPTHSVADQYLAMAGQFIVPITIGYVITQANGWIADLRQGRIELLLSAPLSWPRLVWQRLLAVLAGAAVITTTATVALAVTATAVGAGVDPAGLARLTADTLLVTAALAAVAALAVAWLRSAAAVAVLTVYVAASYLLMYLVPLYAWPDWVNHTTIFGAYGNPYLDIPATSGLPVLTALAVGGGLLATTVARHAPKAAT
jgi:ABC-2 type transport system permease protein